MTSNERNILKYLWDAKGRAPITVISRKVGFTADYTRLICRSLVRTGYLTGADASVCELSTKGRNCFQGSRKTEEDQSKKAVAEDRRQPKTIVNKINRKAKAGINQNEKKKKLQHRRQNHPDTRLDEFKDATPQEKEKLAKAGYTSVEILAAAPVNRLMQDIGVSLKKAADWINQARRKTGMINE